MKISLKICIILVILSVLTACVPYGYGRGGYHHGYHGSHHGY